MSDDRRSSDREMDDLLRMARESSEVYEDLANALDALAKRMLSGKSPDGGSVMRVETVSGAVPPPRFSSSNARLSNIEPVFVQRWAEQY
jgi:hypothetical protein